MLGRVPAERRSDQEEESSLAPRCAPDYMHRSKCLVLVAALLHVSEPRLR